jgi:hypothetical protein
MRKRRLSVAQQQMPSSSDSLRRGEKADELFRTIVRRAAASKSD